MTDSATFTTPEAGDEDTGEDLGGLDDLLASLRSDEAPAPKRGRKPKGSGAMTEGDVVRGNFFYAGLGNRQNVALAAKMGKTPTQTLRSLHKFRQMKSLKYIALATIVMLSGCTYGSQYEADAACSKWIEQGGFYTERFTDVTFSVITFANEEKTVEKKEPLRYCREEKETNQILGFEMKTIKNGQLVEREYNKNYGAEVVKRFRY